MFCRNCQDLMTEEISTNRILRDELDDIIQPQQLTTDDNDAIIRVLPQNCITGKWNHSTLKCTGKQQYKNYIDLIR